MFVPTRDTLDTSCRDDASADPQRAVRLVSDMGPLGRLWLRPEVLALAERFAGGASLPRAPLGSGGFHALLLTPGRGRYASLRPAFALPLRWVVGDAHSPRLPPGLADFATALLAEHGTEFGIAPPPTGRWTLQLGGGLETSCDLSRLDCECGWTSATASLLAGLELGILDAAPSENVMASIAWHVDGLQPVEGVADKLDAALGAGATAVYLAEANGPAASAWQAANPSAKLRPVLLPSCATLRDSLGPYFDAIEARPAASAPLPVLQRFYATRLLQPHQRELRRIYYLETVVGRLAVEYAGSRPLRGKCRNVIGVVGPGTSPPLAFLCRLLAPERALLLHDRSSQPEAATLERHLEGVCGISVVAHEFPSLDGPLSNLRSEVASAIASFLAADAAPPQTDIDTVIDLTGGLKRLTFLLLETAPARAVCVHVDAEREGGGERIGTEQVVPIVSSRRLQ